MVLKGQIISIEFRNNVWILTIDGKIKEFPSYKELHIYLMVVLDKAEDKRKRDLLYKDICKLLK